MWLGPFKVQQHQGRRAGREIGKGCLGAMRWSTKSLRSAYLQRAPKPTGPPRLIYLQNDCEQVKVTKPQQRRLESGQCDENGMWLLTQVLKYFYFQWVPLFYATLNFHFTTFWAKCKKIGLHFFFIILETNIFQLNSVKKSEFNIKKSKCNCWIEVKNSSTFDTRRHRPLFDLNLRSRIFILHYSDFYFHSFLNFIKKKVNFMRENLLISDVWSFLTIITTLNSLTRMISS